MKRVCAAPKPGHAACMSLMRTNVPRHQGLFAAGLAPSGYGPSDLQSAYHLPSASAGGGQTVAIVDAYDDPTAEADLATYRAQYGLPPCTTANGCFKKVNEQGQQGNYPLADSGWAAEISLDMDMVSAICPMCHILLVEASQSSTSDLYAAENEAVALGAKYVSNSWGLNEYSGETTDNQYFNHPGVVITAAGGDSGYLNGSGSDQWPAASPYVTAVGGTTLTRAPGTARGWTERVWNDLSIGYGATGSGCSAYESKPSWQTDPGCANRTTNDVAAVSDPFTGVAVYDSFFNPTPGWKVLGGTSVATPIIAAVYALAGTPAVGSNPASYPYARRSALNDVTSGSDGTCTPAYLCTAGPGYDGPTGLGTPNGVAAFTPATYGTVAGTVTDARTGKPLSGVQVNIGSFSATTGSNGQYTTAVPAGSYAVTFSDYGYVKKTRTGVHVTAGQTTTENFTFTAVPRYTISGTVIGASGHSWPLYATITIAGYPGGPVYTDPYTGAYKVSLPEKTTYTLRVTPVVPGYQPTTLTVSLGTANKVQDFRIHVDLSACDAPGYHWVGGLTQNFDTVSATPPPGWSVTDNVTPFGWRFNPGGTGNYTGGQGNFAFADIGPVYEAGQDTLLTTPAFSLARVTSPVLTFDTYLLASVPGSAEVDLSTDNGQTWTSVWHQTTDITGHISIQVPQAAGKPQVQIRFHFVAQQGVYGSIWEIDELSIGSSPVCAWVPGGLVAGQVTDANTGAAVDAATVAHAGGLVEAATTASTPGVSDGFYELFAAGTGRQQFTATAVNTRFSRASATVNIRANAVTRQDFAVTAGRLSLSAQRVSSTTVLGSSASKRVTFTNTGTAPVHVSLVPQDQGFTPTGGTRQDTPSGFPLERIRGHFSSAAAAPDPVPPAEAKGTGARAEEHVITPGATVPANSRWASIATYPITVMDNAVTYDPANGDVYSVGGQVGAQGYPTYNHQVSLAYVYDPAAESWSPIARAPRAVLGATDQFIHGILYLAGGWDNVPVNATYAYHPSSNTWTRRAPLPVAVYRPASAVVNGQLYVVGGCVDNHCDTSAAVYSYDPASNRWIRHASYPDGPIAYAACAGLGGKLVCAGGLKDSSVTSSTNTTWIYDPASDTWTQGANMPYDDWGMSYAGANGMLEITDGTTVQGTMITNQADAYSPGSNTWTALPNTPTPVTRGGGACGLYTVGGDNTGFFTPVAATAVLPGYEQCGPSVPWLSDSQQGFTLTPGQSTQVTLRLSSSAVTQPGTYAAMLGVTQDTPYDVSAIAVSMQVRPPPSWGEIAGTITDATTGNPIAGASVQICAKYDTKTGGCGPVTYTLTTDNAGAYQLWLSKDYNPLAVNAAADGYQPALKIARIRPGSATTVNIALAKT